MEGGGGEGVQFLSRSEGEKRRDKPKAAFPTHFLFTDVTNGAAVIRMRKTARAPSVQLTPFVAAKKPCQKRSNFPTNTST